MAVNLTLDSLVRQSLAEHHLTLHNYVPFLVSAKRGLDDLRIHTLGIVKVVVLDVDPVTFLADLPSDYIEEVRVGIEVGDKVKPIGHGETLNTRATGGDEFDVESDYVNAPIDYLNQFGTNEYWGFDGGIYGLGVTWVDEYTILRDLDKVRINNKSEITKIHLIYLASEVKVNSKSVVHPFAKEAILTYLSYRNAENNPRNRFDPQVKKKEFQNARRILRASMNKWTVTDVMRSLRKEFRQSTKN